MENKKKTIKNKFTWYLDFRDNNNIYQKLYTDIIDWLWNNSTYVNGEKISAKQKQILSNKDKYGWLPISSFTYHSDTEFIDNDMNPQLILTNSRASKLIRWLHSKNWPMNSIYRLQDCPGFFKTKSEPLYLYTPNRWKNFSKIIKQSISDHFDNKGYSFFIKIGGHRCRAGQYNTYHEIEELYQPIKLFNS